MTPDSNLVNVGTIVCVVVTGGPILKGIERDSVNLVPCTVCVYNVKKGLETVGLSNRRTYAGVVRQKENRATRAACGEPQNRRLLAHAMP